MKTSDWTGLLYLKPSDFKNPDMMDVSIVRALDRFIGMVGSKPTVISDYRPGDPRQHGKGRAVDVVFYGLDPAYVIATAQASKLFKGIGLYQNEVGAESYHFDTRIDSIADPNRPNMWGAFIRTVVDPATNQAKRVYEYLNSPAGLQTVLVALKKKVLPAAAAMSILFGLLILFWPAPKSRK